MCKLTFERGQYLKNIFFPPNNRDRYLCTSYTLAWNSFFRESPKVQSHILSRCAQVEKSFGLSLRIAWGGQDLRDTVILSFLYVYSHKTLIKETFASTRIIIIKDRFQYLTPNFWFSRTLMRPDQPYLSPR